MTALASMAPPPIIDSDHAYWSLGTWFFWPVLALGLLILIGSVIAAATRSGGAIALAVTGVVIAGGAVAVYWPPFDPSFHRWYPVSGALAATPDSRLIKDGEHGVSQRYALRFSGSPVLFGCDDTRCSTLRQGDPVELLCKRQWQFRGVPGWSCVYDQP